MCSNFKVTCPKLNNSRKVRHEESYFDALERSFVTFDLLLKREQQCSHIFNHSSIKA